MTDGDPKGATWCYNRSGIAAACSEVLGWMPSDTQVSRWLSRPGDPIPHHRIGLRGHPRADELRVHEWVRRNWGWLTGERAA